MVGVPRGEFFTTDYTDYTDFFIFFRVNSRYSRLVLARPCEIPKSLFFFRVNSRHSRLILAQSCEIPKS